MDLIDQQKIISEQYASPLYESPSFFKVGISLNIKNQIWPINGLRHPLTNNTTGWYIWAGEEFSMDPEFFVHCMSSISPNGVQ